MLGKYAAKYGSWRVQKIRERREKGMILVIGWGGDSRATPPEEEGDGFANKIFGAIAPISGLSTSRKEGKFHY